MSKPLRGQDTHPGMPRGLCWRTAGCQGGERECQTRASVQDKEESFQKKVQENHPLEKTLVQLLLDQVQECEGASRTPRDLS